MSLSPRRSTQTAGPRLSTPPLASVATPRQLSQRIQQAVSILARGLLREEPELALSLQDGRHPVDGVYHDLLLLTSRLLFLHAAAERTLLESDMLLDAVQSADWKDRRWRRRWLADVQQAVDMLRFLRARDGGLEPSRFAPDDLAAALTALRGEREEHFTAHALGSAYESLMEFHPVLNGATIELATAAGNARKTSGSYYTPDSLIQCLLDTALDPVIEPRSNLLDLKICDPSCGSGQFILAAAARVARKLAGRQGQQAEREALQMVARQCLYGVDLNPIAVELCRFHVWMAADAAMAPADVQQRVQWGDSLMGATPAGLQGRLSSAAFSALTGDHPAVAREHCQAYQALTHRAAVHSAREADAWCAMLVWPRTPTAPPPPVHLAVGDGIPESSDTLRLLDTLRERHRFLHWQLSFPEVFSVSDRPDNPTTGWSGGFDVVLGNPPWERIEVQDKEWFARRDPSIMQAPNAAVRKRLVAELEQRDPGMYRNFVEDRRQSQVELHFLRQSGRYPFTGRGGINRFGPFTETCRMLVRNSGRVGYVVPSGLVHDEMTRPFFADLMQTEALLSLYHFDNRKKLFPAVGGMITFCLLTFRGHGTGTGKPASFVCFAQSPRDLRDAERRFELSADDLALMNPNTQTLPIFRSAADAELTRQVYRNVPVLIQHQGANPWAMQLAMLFQMSGDSRLFKTSAQAGYRPLYEAKMMHQYDHRWATWAGARAVGVKPEARQDPGYEVRPRYWVPATEVERRLERRWSHDWLLVWRDVCRSTDERTVIAAIVPRVGVGHTCQLMFPGESTAALLLANLNSLVLDYVARQKIGGIHLTYNYLQQLPILPPQVYEQPALWQPEVPLRDWIVARVVELTYTSDSVAAFARDHGVVRGPFGWDAERRAVLRAELDAAFFRLYGLSDVQIEHVLSTFPILQRKEMAACGEFRTHRLVWEAFRGM